MRKSRPLTAPPSRFKKRNFPPEIIGIPTTTLSPRINSTRPLSSIQRPVSAPITPARSQYDDLSSTFDNFAEQTSVNITSPYLVAQFLRFSTKFNQFCDTSSTIKNSFFGNYSQRMKIHNASIIVQAQSMMNEWNDFQKFFISVKSINITPIYKLISNCFVNLISAINDCYDLCGVGSRFETIPKPFQKYIDEEIKILNQAAINIYNERIKQFDPLDFYNRTLLFIQNTQTKLLTSFFRNRMTTADVMRRKMALNIAYEDLIKLLNGTQNFDLLAKEVEDQIILMNQSIGELYSSLHLPISLRKVKPIFDDEGRSLNLSILRPSASNAMDKAEALKESVRKANKIGNKAEKVEFKISQKNDDDGSNNGSDKTQSNEGGNEYGKAGNSSNENEKDSKNENENNDQNSNENESENNNESNNKNKNEKDGENESKDQISIENESNSKNANEKDSENANERNDQTSIENESNSKNANEKDSENANENNDQTSIENESSSKNEIENSNLSENKKDNENENESNDQNNNENKSENNNESNNKNENEKGSENENSNLNENKKDNEKENNGQNNNESNNSNENEGKIQNSQENRNLGENENGSNEKNDNGGLSENESNGKNNDEVKNDPSKSESGNGNQND